LTAVTSDAMPRLVTFTAAVPDTFTTSLPITGLQGGEVIVGIDQRPVSNTLFAVTDAGRIYTLAPTPAMGPTSVAATPGPALTADPTDATLPFMLNSFASMGSAFGVDFNPVPDRLRITSSLGLLNLRANVGNGLTFTDTALARRVVGPALVTPTLTSAAYSNSAPGATRPNATALFVVDTANDRLFVQDPPNTGTLVDVGALGINATSSGGFDIIGSVPLVVLTTTGAGAVTNGLFTVDLGRGTVAPIGAINVTGTVTGLAGVPSTVDPAANSSLFAVVNGTQLATFSRNNPGTTGQVAIAGLGSDTLVDIDFRPSTGDETATPVVPSLLYGLGASGTVYLIMNPMGGTPTAVAQTTLAVAMTGGPVTLNGTAFGIDFNPVPDRLRIVSDTNQNLRVNVVSGVTNVDGNINLPAAPAPVVTAAAYSNNFAGATGTTLYDLDLSTNSSLMIQELPNDGTLNQVGRLDPIFPFTTNASFDIAGGANGLSYAVLQRVRTINNVAAPDTQSTLYRVNLLTGAATAIGPIGPMAMPTTISAFAIRLQ